MILMPPAPLRAKAARIDEKSCSPVVPLSRKSASSWVDRGESAIPKLRLSLAHYFERFDIAAEPFLDEHATFVYGMVAADSTDVQLAMYLRGVVRSVGFPNRQPLGTRLFAISMWHIAKVALVRDAANRALHQRAGAIGQSSETLGSWLAERLMTPEELLVYQQRIDELREGDADAEVDSAYAD